MRAWALLESTTQRIDDHDLSPHLPIGIGAGVHINIGALVTNVVNEVGDG